MWVPANFPDRVQKHRRVAVREPHARGADAPAQATSDPNTGRVLDGRYRIGGRIARGGMAGVYEATDLRLERTVAVKIMHAGLGDTSISEEDFAARFVREARSAARLSHPNIVSVYDQGEDHGTIFLAMEYVPGHTLRDTVSKESPMAPEKALALLDPVLSALAAAHRAGLVHRDVKPENVLIADDGRIKVADFGLAKAVSADTQHTVTQGVLIGTVSYLAPELVVEGIADARVDVYAAGVMLYELLTGTKPHTGDSPIQVAYAHAHNDVPAPSARVPGLPPYVDALVARATTRDRGLRPADAGVLLHHVRRVQAALHQGLADDPELVADLLPHARGGRVEDTRPEPIDDVRQEWAPDRHERTQVIETTPPPPRRLPPATAVPPGRPRDRRRRRWRGPVILLVAALLAALMGGGAYWFGWARYTSTPSVLGDSHAQATAQLDRAGLTADYTSTVYSDSVPKGHVVSTDPAPGRRILPHHTVSVTLSKGPELHNVPDVHGETVSQATSGLSAVKLVVSQQIQRWSETVPSGHVIATDPAYGSKAGHDLPVGTGVHLIVSKGRKPIKVTSEVGNAAGPAAHLWRHEGLKVQVRHRHSTSVAQGDIIDQTPEHATLHKGDTVSITVSSGPPYVTVPSVWGETTADATNRLQALGLQVRIAHSAFYVGAGRAVNTDPKSGTSVRKGSVIVVYVV